MSPRFLPPRSNGFNRFVIILNLFNKTKQNKELAGLSKSNRIVLLANPSHITNPKSYEILQRQQYSFSNEPSLLNDGDFVSFKVKLFAKIVHIHFDGPMGLSHVLQ